MSFGAPFGGDATQFGGLPPEVYEALQQLQAQQQAQAAAPQQVVTTQGPGGPNDLLFNRAPMGGGLNPFVPQGPTTTGSVADPNVPVAMTEADTRQMERAMMPAPTGGIPAQNRSPDTPRSAPPIYGTNPDRAPVPGMPGVAAQPSVTAASTGNPDASNVAPVNSFDPLTGQPVSGNPKPMRAPGDGGPTDGAGRVAQAAGVPQAAGQSPNLLERFAKGLNNPEVGNLLLNVGIGLMSQRGFGPGIAAGLQGYQASQAGNVKQALEQFKLQQQIQGQQAQLKYLIGKGYSPDAAAAMIANGTLLTDELSKNKAPSGYRFTADGQTQEAIPGGPEDIARQAQAAAAIAAAKNAAVPSAPIQVRPNATLVDPNTMQPVFKAPGDKPEGFETEDKLRTEFTKQMDTFNKMHEGYGRIVAATQDRAANPNKVSPAADMSLIFGYMKLLDPGSVVKETEYATAKNAAGVPDQIRNTWNKLLKGETLTPEQRIDFTDQGQKLYDQERKVAEEKAGHFKWLAEQYKVQPDRVAKLPDRLEMPNLPTSSGAAAIPAAAPNDRQIQALMADPDKYRDQFDAKFGRGAATRYLKAR